MLNGLDRQGLKEARFPPACHRADLRKARDWTCLLSLEEHLGSRSCVFSFPGEKYFCSGICTVGEESYLILA